MSIIITLMLTNHELMNCKNCSTLLKDIDHYCNNCGAKVITNRITIKGLLADLSQNIFGWDNKYLYTLVSLLKRPGILLREIFDGTRKKYVNPFAFLALGMAVNLFAFNAFDNEFFLVMENFNEAQLDWYSETLGGPFSDPDFKKEQLAQSRKTMSFMLKYFNLLALVLMPFYTFLAFIVYRKPYNFAEHLVANCYIQGLSFLSTTVIFFTSIWIHPVFYLLIYPLLIFYYTYIYGRLYQLTFWNSVLKVIIFLAVLSTAAIALIIISFAIGLVYAKFFQ